MKGFVSILLFELIFLAACSQKNKNRLNILFDKVDNLQKGGDVKLHGITIGEVTAMDLLGDSVLVAIKLEKEQKIPIGSKFSITNPLIGSPSITIEPSGQKEFLTQTDTAKGCYETKGVLDTFFSDSLNRQKAKKVIDTINNRLKELIELKKESGENK